MTGASEVEKAKHLMITSILGMAKQEIEYLHSEYFSGSCQKDGSVRKTVIVISGSVISSSH